MKPENRVFVMAMSKLAVAVFVAVFVGMGALVVLMAATIWLLFPDGLPWQVDQAIRVASGGVFLLWLTRMLYEWTRERRASSDAVVMNLKRRALVEAGWRGDIVTGVWRHRDHPGRRFGVDAAFAQLKSDIEVGEPQETERS